MKRLPGNIAQMTQMKQAVGDGGGTVWGEVGCWWHHALSQGGNWFLCTYFLYLCCILFSHADGSLGDCLPPEGLAGSLVSLAFMPLHRNTDAQSILSPVPHYDLSGPSTPYQATCKVWKWWQYPRLSNQMLVRFVSCFIFLFSKVFDSFLGGHLARIGIWIGRVEF